MIQTGDPKGTGTNSKATIIQKWNIRKPELFLAKSRKMEPKIFLDYHIKKYSWL
jgi:hypothetical protein